MGVLCLDIHPTLNYVVHLFAVCIHNFRFHLLHVLEGFLNAAQQGHSFEHCLRANAPKGCSQIGFLHVIISVQIEQEISNCTSCYFHFHLLHILEGFLNAAQQGHSFEHWLRANAPKGLQPDWFSSRVSSLERSFIYSP